MNTDRMWPEHVVSGFFHLIWVVLLAVCLLEVDPRVLGSSFTGLSTGAAAILGSVAVGASFYLGSLSSRLLTDLSEIVKKPRSEGQFCSILRGANKDELDELKGRWSAKSLYRSVGVALLLIMFFGAILVGRYDSGKSLCAFLVVGGMLALLTIIAFFTQRRSHERLLDAISEKKQNDED